MWNSTELDEHTDRGNTRNYFILFDNDRREANSLHPTPTFLVAVQLPDVTS